MMIPILATIINRFGQMQAASATGISHSVNRTQTHSLSTQCLVQSSGLDIEEIEL